MGSGQGWERPLGEQLASKRGRGVPGEQGMGSKAQATISTTDVGTGFLCHLATGRPMAQGPRDEAGGWNQTAEAEA